MICYHTKVNDEKFWSDLNAVVNDDNLVSRLCHKVDKSYCIATMQIVECDGTNVKRLFSMRRIVIFPDDTADNIVANDEFIELVSNAELDKSLIHY